jgi:hypothetical protein
VERDLPRRRARLLARQSSVGEFASRFTGSSDLYESDGRQPFASINFVTAHDGFTLRDLVSYNEKHNEANLEDNRDGTDDNRSWNCGVEGETTTRGQRAARRQQRNFLATLFLSQGVPMAAGRRRDRPQPGRQQQRLVPGQRDLLVRVGAAAGPGPSSTTSHASSSASARATGCSAARSSWPAASRRARGCPTCGGSGPTAAG